MTTTDRTGADDATFEADGPDLAAAIATIEFSRIDEGDETEGEAAARRFLARHYRAMASAVNVGDWQAYIRVCARAQEDGTAWFDHEALAELLAALSNPAPGTDSIGQASEHEVVVEVYDGIAIGMRCATCGERIPVRPEGAAISVAEVDRLARDHAPGTDSSGQAREAREERERAFVRDYDPSLDDPVPTTGDPSVSRDAMRWDGPTADVLADSSGQAVQRVLDLADEWVADAQRADDSEPATRDDLFRMIAVSRWSRQHAADLRAAVAGPQRDHGEEGACAPDCDERADCPDVSSPGHSQCGRRADGTPRHHSAEGHPETALERQARVAKARLSQLPEAYR